MAPGVVAHEIVQLRRRFEYASPGNSSSAIRPSVAEASRVRRRTNRMPSTTASRSSAAAFLEVAEVDQGRVARVGGAKRDFAGAVLRYAP